MSEAGADQLPPKDRAEQLQNDFGKYVDKLHQLAGNAFGEAGDRFIAPGRHDKNAELGLADELLLNFDSLYRRIPQGYHLDMGLSPLKWYELQNDEQLKLLTRKEMTPIGPQYLLRVGRFVENPSAMQPSASTLNVNAIGNTSPDNPTAKLEPVWVSKDSQRRTGKSIYPEDILSVKVATNTQNP